MDTTWNRRVGRKASEPHLGLFHDPTGLEADKVDHAL